MMNIGAHFTAYEKRREEAMKKSQQQVSTLKAEKAKMKEDFEKETSEEKKTINQLLSEAEERKARYESLELAFANAQSALANAESSLERSSQEVASLHAQLQSVSEEAEQLRSREARAEELQRKAFESGITALQQNFRFTDKGRQLISSARVQLINRYLDSMAYATRVNDIALPYFEHGFKAAQEQAVAMGATGKFRYNRALKDAPAWEWNGNPEEKEDFAWWEDVEKNIWKEFSELEVLPEELTSAASLPLSSYGEPSEAHLAASSSGVQENPPVVTVDLDEEEDDDVPLAQRRRSETTPALTTANPPEETAPGSEENTPIG